MRRLLLLLLLLTLAGCAARTEEPPAPPAEEAPAPAEELSPVYTDWSKLTPYEPVREVYTYHAGYRADDIFEPRGDYGVLLPYVGRYASMEQYVIEALPLYGLVTDRGELVSEAVYAEIDFRGEFLLLYRGDPENGVSGGDSYAGGMFSRTLAAADGRWAHELTDSYYVTNGFGLLVTAATDGSLAVWNEDGEVVMRFDGGQFKPWLGDDFVWGMEGGPFLFLQDGRVCYVISYLVNGEYRDAPVRLYLDLTGGAVLTEPPAGYGQEPDYSAIYGEDPEPPEVAGCRYLQPVTDPVTGEICFFGWRSGNGAEGGHYALFDGAGDLLVENVSMGTFEMGFILRAGLCSTLEDGCFCFRSLHGSELVFRRILRTNSD